MKYIWQNGEIKTYSSETCLDFYSGAFRYGIVLFDGLWGEQIKGDQYAVFRPNAHLERILAGLGEIGLKKEYTKEILLHGIEQVIKTNRPSGKFGIRIFAYGNEQGFLDDGCSVVIFLLDLKIVSFNKHISLYAGSGSLCRYNNGISNSIKCTCHYVIRRAIMIIQFKRLKRKYDDVVFSDSHGNVLETSKANIFFIKDSKVYTPSSRLNLLNGITRQSLVEFICIHGAIIGSEKVNEAKFSVEELKKADEIFVTSSSLGIEFVESINGKKLANKYSKVIKEAFNNYIYQHSQWMHIF